jgi:hypothetical protein
VPYGSSCASQSRTCSNGTLSGSYPYSSCSVNAPLVPTCSVTISPNPSAYASSGTPVIVAWSGSNADEVYVSNVGWLGTSGSTRVASQQSTDYSCIGYSAAYGYGSWQSYSLAVTPPSSPTTSITSSRGSTVLIGQSSSISATFAAGSGDTLTGDSIDSPAGTGVGPNTNPTSPKTYTFTPSAPGTYTFYGRATTSYFPSWTTYNSVSVTVPTPPTASLTLSPATIGQGQSSTLSWSSTNATSCTISTIGSVGTSGSRSVSPAQSTTYTGSCTGPGGTAQFNSGSGATLSLSCTPAYSCSGSNIQYTSASCQVSTAASCVAPAFCSAGSSQCLYPSISFNQTANNTGHLQIVPQILQAGASAKVYWNVSNASSCSVTGTNGDSWSGLASPTTGQTTAPIQQATVYTLSCTPLSGATSSAVSETKTVNITPVFNEQ